MSRVKRVKKTPEGSALSRYEKYLPFILGAVSLIVFLPAVSHGFINMDDVSLIERNNLLNPENPHGWRRAFLRQLYSPHYKPMVYLSWRLESVLFGLKPSVLHFDNILLHAVSTALVYRLAMSVLPAMWGRTRNMVIPSALCASIWALHPLRVESVVWAVERKDVLFGLFYLLACLMYIRFVRSGHWKFLLLATAAYLLSCLSKSMGITFLGITFLIDWLFKGNAMLQSRLLLAKVPFLAVFLVAMHLYGFLMAPENDKPKVTNSVRKSTGLPEPINNYPGSVKHLTVSNLRAFLLAAHTGVPVKRAVVYPRNAILDTFSHLALPLLLLPFCILAVLVWKPPLRPTMGFGLAWFAIALSPILVEDGVGTNFLSDRYTYIPSIGMVFWLIPGLIFLFDKAVWGKLTAGHLLAAAILVSFTAMTITQVGKWRSSLSLWNQVIDNYPNNWYAYYNRGKLLATTDPDRALDDFSRSIQAQSDRADTYYSRGTIYMSRNEPEKAIADFSRAIEFDPKKAEPYINRGSCYKTLKQTEAAIQDFTKAIDLRGGKVKGLNNRGLAYFEAGRLDRALADFNSAIDANPKYVPARINRGNVYLNPTVGRFEEAVSDFQFATERSPADDNAWFRLGYALAQLGRHREAIAPFTQAIDLQPDQGFYYFGRAQSYQRMGMNDKALVDYRTAASRGVNVDPAILQALQ